MTDRIKRAVFILMRLYHNQAGNTLMIVAAALLPLLGLVGGGVDMSRLYLTKARLQQACDAGALAGRKQMGAGAWNANNNKANSVAEQLFDANFTPGSYGTGLRTRSFSESGGKVTGTASAPVPMTVMKVFGFTSKTVAVTCDSEMRIPNTDVMFVLDTTGSMDSYISGDTVKKIDGLKKAVKCFYEALQKVDVTDVDCGSIPSGGNSATVQLRFGFVPYATNVNVGYLLHNDWMADSWTYQSRVFSGTAGTWGNWQSIAATWGACPEDTASIQYRNRTQGSFYGFTYCSAGEYRALSGGTSQWTYQPVTWNISGLKNGGFNWHTSINLPIGANGADVPVDWEGCIEERQTYKNTDGNPSDDWDPVQSSAYDMDIDMVPSGAAGSKWGPSLPSIVYTRTTVDGSGAKTSTKTHNPVTYSGSMGQDFTSSCPVTSRRLTAYPTSGDFKNYVNSLSAAGSTYHDIGLVWGARLLSPTGLFASDNALTPNGGTIERHLIFMTDGKAEPTYRNLAAYGMPWYDRRQLSDSTTSNSDITDGLTDLVNARTSALCKAIKNKNITLWVIYYGAVGSDDYTRLSTCASSGRFYNATNSTQLIDKFKSIANEISQLRLTN